MPTKPCTQLRSVEGIQYELVRKKVKQLHLRVRSNGTVMVSIPLTASLEQADRFVLQNAQWIRDTRVKNIAKRNRDNADLPDKATALAYFTAMSDKVYPAFAGVLGGRDFEILFDASFNNDRFAASKLHHFGIAHPIGGRHDDLVAVVDQRHDGVANRLFGTVGAANLVGSIVQSVFIFQFLHDSLAQSRVSSNGRIA